MNEDDYLYHKSLMKSAAFEFNTSDKEIINKSHISKKSFLFGF